MSTLQTARTADGLAYDRAGHGGRPLVLVDGLGQMRAIDTATRDLAVALAGRGYDVVHHDRPGRGDSADALAAALPDGRRGEVPGAEHTWALDDMAAVLDEHLR